MASRLMAAIQERADLIRENTALLDKADIEGRGLSDAEAATLDANIPRIAALTTEIDRMTAVREAERIVANNEPRRAGPLDGLTDRAAGKPWGHEFGVRVIEQADGTTRLGGVGDARMSAAVALGCIAQAIHRQAVGGAVDPRLGYQAAALGLNEAVPQEGGLFLTTEISNEIQLMVRTGAILSRVDRATMTGPVNSIRFNVLNETSRVDGSRSGGVRAYWVEEAGTKTASTLSFRGVELRAWKLAALGYASDEILADVGFLGNFLLDAFAEELRFKAEDAIIRGTGAGMPLGILNSTGNAVIEVGIDSGQVLADGISFANITAMWARLDARSQASAVWLVNQAMQPLLQGMTMNLGTTAYPVYLPPGGISAAPFGSIFGAPVIVNEYMPAPGTPGDIMLADLSQYRFVEKGGIETASSIHVQFITDQTAFRAVWRVGGAPKWIAPLTPYQGTATVSPFVTLGARV